MDNKLENNPIEDLSTSAKDYLNLKVDQIKLSLAENLSVVLNKMVFFFLIIILGAIAFVFLSFSLSSYLSVLLNSAVLGNLITCSIFLLIIVVLCFFRNKLFTNNFVRMFVKMLFDTKKKQDE